MVRALPLACLLAAACASDPGAPLDGGGSEDLARAAPDFAPAGLGPPYPIVLVHGMGGFRNIGPVDYFYGVIAALRADGHDVWVSRQDPVNGSEVRGEQVRAFVEQVLISTGKARAVLVGHSQGGFDVRYAASALGPRVAAVVTIAAPMKGDPIADLALGGGPRAQEAITALLDLYGAANGFDSDAKAQIRQLTAAGAAEFFARHPDDLGVAYYSLAGRSAGAPAGGECDAPEAPPFVRRWDPERDPVSPLLATPSGMLDALKPRPVHDGLVPVASARHGTFLGCLPADHLDEVNQLFGDHPGPGNSFDAVQFYRDLASWLVARGY